MTRDVPWDVVQDMLRAQHGLVDQTRESRTLMEYQLLSPDGYVVETMIVHCRLEGMTRKSGLGVSPLDDIEIVVTTSPIAYVRIRLLSGEEVVTIPLSTTVEVGDTVTIEARR